MIETGKRAFTQFRPAQPLSRILSWWWSAAFVSAIQWFRSFWTSASVTEVMVVPTLKWLLTLGLISLIFLVFFVAVCGEEAPAESRSIAALLTLSHWSTSAPRPPAPCIASPCRVETHRVSAISEVGTVACGRAGAVGPGLWRALGSLIISPILTLW